MPSRRAGSSVAADIDFHDAPLLSDPHHRRNEHRRFPKNLADHPEKFKCLPNAGRIVCPKWQDDVWFRCAFEHALGLIVEAALDRIMLVEDSNQRRHRRILLAVRVSFAPNGSD